MNLQKKYFLSTRTRGYVFLAPFGAGRFSVEHAARCSPPRRETIAQSTGIDVCVVIMVLNWCDCCYTFDRCDTMSLQTLVRVRIRRVNTGPFSSVCAKPVVHVLIIHYICRVHVYSKRHSCNWERNLCGKDKLLFTKTWSSISVKYCITYSFITLGPKRYTKVCWLLPKIGYDKGYSSYYRILLVVLFSVSQLCTSVTGYLYPNTPLPPVKIS